MEVILVLVPISLVIMAVAVWLFMWAVDHGQYEDVDRGAEQALADDDAQRPGHANDRKTT